MTEALLKIIFLIWQKGISQSFGGLLKCASSSRLANAFYHNVLLTPEAKGLLWRMLHLAGAGGQWYYNIYLKFFCTKQSLGVKTMTHKWIWGWLPWCCQCHVTAPLLRDSILELNWVICVSNWPVSGSGSSRFLIISFIHFDQPHFYLNSVLSPKAESWSLCPRFYATDSHLPEWELSGNRVFLNWP